MQTLKEEATEWARFGLEDAGKSFEPLNLSIEQKIRHKKLLNRDWDFNLCIFCQKPISEIGGRKLVNTSSIKILISDTPTTDSEYQCIQLEDEPRKYLLLKGSKWTDESIHRVVSLITDDFKPWFCQVCSHKTCNKCGNPSQHVQGADLLNGSHCGIFPIQIGCVSRSCENHNPDWTRSTHIK
jgi:hypothetical protein